MAGRRRQKGSQRGSRRSRSKTQSRQRAKAAGAQFGVLGSPPGISPPANRGRQERAAAIGKKPGILQQIKEFLPDLIFKNN